MKPLTPKQSTDIMDLDLKAEIAKDNELNPSSKVVIYFALFCVATQVGYTFPIISIVCSIALSVYVVTTYKKIKET